MKKRILMLLLTLATLFCTVGLTACDKIDDVLNKGDEQTQYSKGLGFALSLDKTHYIVCDIGVCTDEDITIPSIYNGLAVTSIGFGAFSGCSSLKTITVPDGVTSIGDYAFWYCSSLTIYCEAESQPSGWDGNWNPSNCLVEWGYKGE